MKRILIIILTITVSLFFISSEIIESDTQENIILNTTYSNLPILHLNGTPYENGFQHGQIMKSRIHELVGLWKKDIEKKYQIPANKFIIIFLDSTDYIFLILKNGHQIYWKRLKGLVQALE